MARTIWAGLKKTGIVAAWIVGGGGLVLSVFVLSFYLAMKLEMRSTEVVVPDLIGMTQEEAAQAAVPVDLLVEVVDQRHDPAVSSGKVLQQEPRPGLAVRRGRTLKVVLSLGGKVLTVPELAGRPSRTVEIDLRREGFFPGNEAQVHSLDAAVGSVIAQVPPSGSPSVPGERVHRLVSLGPTVPRWVMPDLAGRPRGEVERWLRLSGFRAGPIRKVSWTGEPSGTVVGQVPRAGYPVRTLDVVQLTVAR
jgi:serine/threonine-protein kinase